MDISNAELARQIDNGFDALARRIDLMEFKLSGQERRLNDHDTQLSDRGMRLETLAVELGRVGGDSKRPAPATPSGPDLTSKPITRWDLTVFCAGSYLVIELLPKILAALGK